MSHAKRIRIASSSVDARASGPASTTVASGILPLDTLWSEVVPRLEGPAVRLANGALPCSGFVHLLCDGCGARRRLHFRCAGECLMCPARARERASGLVQLIPRVPVRLWTLGLPVEWRAAVAHDRRLVHRVAREFVREVFAMYREALGPALGVPADRVAELSCGAASLVHRLGSALNLNVHVHLLALDGVYRTQGDQLAFHPLGDDPPAAKIHAIARRLREVVMAGLGPALGTSGRPVTRRNLVPIDESSVRHRAVSGPMAQHSVRRVRVDDPEGSIRPSEGAAGPDTAVPSPAPGRERTEGGIRVVRGGVAVHATPQVAAGDRRSVLRLSRYLTRPSLDPTDFARTEGGTIRYRLEHPFADGTTHVEFSPSELAERLTALVPEGPVHRVGYHGVLAPRAVERWRVVPTQLLLLEEVAPAPSSRPRSGSEAGRRAVPATPAELFRCEPCEKPMRVLGVEEESDLWLGDRSRP